MLAQLNPGLDNLHLRRRPVVRLELHRRDHRDPRRRRDPHRAAGRAELAAGSGGRRRRPAVRRRRHLLLRGRARRLAADRRHAVHPGLPGLPARPGPGGPGRVRGDHIRRPGRPLPARRRAKPTILADGFDQLYGVAIAPGGRSCSPNSAPGGCCRCGRATSRRAGLRPARSGRRGDRTRRRVAGRRVGCGPGGDG